MQRLNIVRNADVIIVMAGGKIVEQGSHDELVAQRGHYFKMYHASRGEEM
jgi:ABC-type multidrug transport system fused ATPase/permease subunit